MERKVIKILKYRIKKRFKKIKNKSNRKYNILFSKIIFIFILLIILIIIYNIPSKKNQLEKIIKKEDDGKFMIELNGKREIVDPSKLSLNEHYKILLPRIKYHPPHKKIKLEDAFKNENFYDLKRKKETGKDKHYSHTCICSIAKNQNIYVREYIEYYLSIGVEKFYFGDDNPEGFENLGDALDDYIKKGIVEIEYIRHLNIVHHIFVQQVFDNIKFRCKWTIFSDYDEFLEFSDKNMNIQTYLDMPVFDKCDTVRIHWMLHDDNNLVYYDNRHIMQRLNHSLPYHSLNRYHKSIVRGKDYGGLIFPYGAHQPEESFVYNQCDALGNFERLGKGILGSPKFKYCWFNHYRYRTAEEFAIKLLRGLYKGEKYNYENKLNEFKDFNELTEEKLKVIENILNTTFPSFHKKQP